MVRLLLQSGADPTKPGWMQLSALQVASEWKDSSRHPELKRIFEMLDRVARKPSARRDLEKRARRRH
jgi:hypothetical protein